MDETTLKIILGIFTLLAAIFGGAFISKKFILQSNKKNKQKNITIKGKGNKFVGSDDNSVNI